MRLEKSNVLTQFEGIFYAVMVFKLRFKKQDSLTLFQDISIT